MKAKGTSRKSTPRKSTHRKSTTHKSIPRHKQAAALSPTGAAALTMGGVVALSCSGSIFFSTFENYIPNNMTNLKLVVNGLKFRTALPIRCVEWTSNQIIGFAENVTMGYQLPINITDAYKLSIGPKLKNQ